MPACEPEVAEGLLGCLRPLLEPAADVRDAVAEHEPDPCQSVVVFCLLEERQRRPREPLELVDRRVVFELRAGVGGDDEGECLPGLVAGRASPLGRLLGDRRSLARRLLRAREIELEVNIEPQRPGQLERPLEQRGGRSSVGPPEGAAAGGGEMLTGPLGESRIGCPSSAL